MLALRRSIFWAECSRLKPRRERGARDFVAALDHVFGEEVKDLSAIVRGISGPARRIPRGFNGVANVFSVAERCFAEQLTFAPINRERVARVGTRLFAADVLLHSAVDIRGSCDCWRGIFVVIGASIFAAFAAQRQRVQPLRCEVSYMPSRPPSRP